jgi:hypothetical protein|tara:strand:+ start:21131 stop:23110 length:1980 start_codon:yes stop_codon:yes gene_type:complete
MIIELFGQSGSGKSTFGKLLAKEIGAVYVNPKPLTNYNGVISFALHSPIKCTILIIRTVWEGKSSWKLFRHKLHLLFRFLDNTEEARHLSKNNTVILDEGLAQYAISLFEGVVSEKNARRYVKQFVTSDTIVVLNADKKLREKRMKGRGRIPRYHTTIDREGWEESVEENSKTIKQALLQFHNVQEYTSTTESVSDIVVTFSKEINVKKTKTIFITFSRGSLVRNFFHTGVITKLLESGIRVVALTPHYTKEIFGEYEHPNLFFEELEAPRGVRGKKLIAEFFKGAIFNKDVYLRFKYRFAGTRPLRLLVVPRVLFFAILRFIPGFKPFIRFIDYKVNPQKEHDYLFGKYKPDLVFATTARTGSDVGVLKSAKRFGIKTIDMPKSWDNLSRMLFDVKTDHMIVWNSFMKEQALSLQGYKKEEVSITGAPQFDYYTDQNNLLSREAFCKEFGFDPKKKIILYGSAGKRCSNETIYIEHIQELIREGVLPYVQILIRPHLGYVGDADKFKSVEPYRGVVVDRTDKQSVHFKDHWDTSKNHLHHLFNSLSHADVCINISSTLAIDATLCNTPVINIAFDIDPKTPLEESPRRLYQTNYMSEVMSFGVTWLVKTTSEFNEAITGILEKEKGQKVHPEKFIERLAYRRDGKAAERIAAVLIKLI